MPEMTSRQRVLCALEHEEPDRVPIDVGGGLCSISQFAYRRLLASLGWTEDVTIGGMLTQVVRPSPRMLERLGSDFAHISAGAPDDNRALDLQGSSNEPFESYVSGTAQGHTWMDEWGVVWRRSAYYYEMVGYPLKDATSVDDLEQYRWPDPRDPGRFLRLREQAQAARARGLAVTLDPLAGGILEMACSLRQHSNFYIDMVDNTALAGALLDRVTDYFAAFYEEALGVAGEFIDIVFFGDDYGAQRGMIISPRQWREMIKPRLARLIATIKRVADVRYQHHSCGAIAPIVPDLIEIGVDILNPVQPSAAGLDPAAIKRDYGHRLVLHGAVDQQDVLPHGSAADVREEALRRIRDLAPGGGYIVAVSPNIQADVPPANILALFDTVQAAGRYPITVKG
jgi:uroporphyrinogen decarboxylase